MKTKDELFATPRAYHEFLGMSYAQRKAHQAARCYWAGELERYFAGKRWSEWWRNKRQAQKLRKSLPQ